MNRDEILAMPAGRGMDALIAEKVMGNSEYYYYCPHFDDKGRMLSFCSCPELPRFSTDIAAVWLLAEKLGFVIGPEWSGGFDSVRVGWCVYRDWISAAADTWSNDADAHSLAMAPTAPLAICRASLIAVLDTETLK